MRIGFLIIVAAILLSSCRSTRKIQTAIAKKDTTSVVIPQGEAREDSLAVIRTQFTKLMDQSIMFNTFNAKIDVDYVGGDGKKENVNATLRMHKDSIIWVSITGPFGIEGLRAIISRDSIRIINKLEKEYTARPLEFLQEVTGLPLELSSLQDLLAGNPVFFDSNIVSFSKSGNNLSLLCVGPWFKNLVTLTDGVLAHSKMDDVDINRNRTCELNYDDYESKKGQNFSTKRRITVTEKSKLDIKLNFKSYSFNETLSFPFSVPRNYKSN
jgi:hypothetical protein